MKQDSYYLVLFAFCAALFISFVSMAILNHRKKANQNLNSRTESSIKATQYLGGIILLVSIISTIFIFVNPEYLYKIYGFAIGACLITLFGFLTDIKLIDPKLQLLSHLISACAAYGFGIRVDCFGGFIGINGMILGEAISFLATILWVVIIVNAINVTNNLYGLTIGLAIIAALCIGYMAFTKEQFLIVLLMVIVCGGCIGFFPFNMHPRKVPLGYSGSQLLGYCLSTLVLIDRIPIKGAMAIALFIPILVLCLTIVNVIYRFLKGADYKVPKDYFYRKIIWTGFAYKRAIILVYCISGVMGIVAILYNERYIVDCLGLCAIVLMLFYVLVSDTYSRNINIKAIDAARMERKNRKANHEKTGC